MYTDPHTHTYTHTHCIIYVVYRNLKVFTILNKLPLNPGVTMVTR